MSGWVVLLIVVGVVALVSALIWWSSGRAKPLRRRGHVDQTNAHLHQVQSQARNTLGGIHGGGGYN